MSEARRSPEAGSWCQSLADEAETQELGRAFARHARPPLAVWLRGDLGTGKTTFARAYIQALGFQGYVKSPSYGLLETYPLAAQTVLHLDLYRIEDPEELEYLALRDLYDTRSVLLVEWPERGAGNLPQADLVLEFEQTGEARFVNCRPLSEAGQVLAKTVIGEIRKALSS